MYEIFRFLSKKKKKKRYVGLKAMWFFQNTFNRPTNRAAEIGIRSINLSTIVKGHDPSDPLSTKPDPIC